MFVLYTFFDKKLSDVSLEEISTKMNKIFKNDDNFSIKQEKLPFNLGESIMLRWGNEFSTRLSIDKKEIETVDISSGPNFTENIKSSTHYIKTVFSDDESKEFTNHIIQIMEFLDKIPESYIYNPEKMEFIKIR